MSAAATRLGQVRFSSSPDSTESGAGVRTGAPVGVSLHACVRVLEYALAYAHSRGSLCACGCVCVLVCVFECGTGICVGAALVWKCVHACVCSNVYLRRADTAHVIHSMNSTVNSTKFSPSVSPIKVRARTHAHTRHSRMCKFAMIFANECLVKSCLSNTDKFGCAHSCSGSVRFAEAEQSKAPLASCMCTRARTCPPRPCSSSFLVSVLTRLHTYMHTHEGRATDVIISLPGLCGHPSGIADTSASRFHEVSSLMLS